MSETTIKGMNELHRKLAQMPTKIHDRVVSKALRAGAEIVQEAITERAPENATGGGSIPFGALRSDIVIHLKRDEDGVQHAIIGPDKETAHVARWVEYGHRMVTGGRSYKRPDGKTVGPGTQVGEVPEHPFIRPAWEEVHAEVEKTINTTLVTETQRVWKEK